MTSGPIRGYSPYFRKMETDLDYPGGDFHGDDGPIPVRRYPRNEWLPHATAFQEACLSEGFPDDPDQNHPESTGVSPRARNTLEGVRISTAIAYLGPARHRLNLTVKADVHARRVLFDNKRAVGVEVESGGDIFSVEGENIILSSGAIGSPPPVAVIRSGTRGTPEKLRRSGGTRPPRSWSEPARPSVGDSPVPGQGARNPMSRRR